MTRSLRGNRLRRTLALSIVLAIVSVLTGAWLALGHGQFEQDVRTGFDLEVSIWDRMRTEHAVIVHDDFELEMVRHELDQLLRHGLEATPEWGTVANSMRQAAATLHAAAVTSPPGEHAELQARAQALLDTGAWTLVGEYGWHTQFYWNDSREVERLTAIVDGGIIPQVERYRSPLGLLGALTMIGLVGGGALMFGLLAVGPLMVGTQVAQEAHENTLAPLTGTALGARDLVIGLSAGPLVVLATILAPQALLFLAAAATTGYLAPALAMIAVALLGSALLVMLTWLAGLALGRRQSPGLVGTALLAGLAIVFFIGAALGFELERETLGLVTILPHAGVMHLLREALAPAGRLVQSEAFSLDLRLVIGAIAFGILAAVTLAAAERRVAGTPGPTLRRAEALVAAATLVVTSVLVPPTSSNGFAEGQVLGSLALVMVPFMLLVMGRVHIGAVLADGRAHVRGPVLELAGFVGLHVLGTTIAAGGPEPWLAMGPIAIVHLVWAIAVAGLIAVRVVTVPVRLLGALYIGFCSVMVLIAFVTAAVFGVDHSTGPMFALSHLSPVLGALQVVLTIAIPWTLLRRPRAR